MRHFHTAVVERRELFSGAFETQPHEAAWASEAIYFVRVEEVVGQGALRAAVQISVDGTRWLDEGTVLEDVSGEGDHFVRVRHFGGWLRLRGQVGGGASFRLTVQLALKE